MTDTGKDTEDTALMAVIRVPQSPGRLIKLVASEAEFLVALNKFGGMIGKDYSIKGRQRFIKHYAFHLAAMHENPAVRRVAQTFVIHDEHMNLGKKVIDDESTRRAMTRILDYRISHRHARR